MSLFYILLVPILYAGYTLGFGALAPRLIRWREKRHALQEENPPPLLISSNSIESENDHRD